MDFSNTFLDSIDSSHRDFITAGLIMKEVKGYRLYVQLGASRARKRLAGSGYGVRKVETAGRNRALIIHTATGQHRRELHRLFEDVIEPGQEEE